MNKLLLLGAMGCCIVAFTQLLRFDVTGSGIWLCAALLFCILYEATDE